MSDVFISHVEEDADVALEIARGLEAAGYTTWSYERDSYPGLDYLDQVDRAIEESRAVVVVISPDSLGSQQVEDEVKWAREQGKRFLPVLKGISWAEFQNRRPRWRMALGIAAAVRVPPEGVGAVLPRVTRGLEELGVKPRGSPAHERLDKAARVGESSPLPRPEQERRDREKAEAERLAREKAEAERKAVEKAEQERLARAARDRAEGAGCRLEIWPFIAVPAAITVAITLLRLVGELEHWSPTFFNATAGGGGAVVGISWLAPVFGIYFAVRLVRAGEGPPSAGRAVAFALLGAAVGVGGLFLTQTLRLPFHGLLLCIWLASGLAAVITLAAWPALWRVLLGYGYAARIPVAIIMILAFRGHWGTHYDAAPPIISFANVWTEYLWLGFFPQLVFWVGYTIVSGMLLGSTVAVFVHPGRPDAESRRAAAGDNLN